MSHPVFQMEVDGDCGVGGNGGGNVPIMAASVAATAVNNANSSSTSSVATAGTSNSSNNNFKTRSGGSGSAPSGSSKALFLEKVHQSTAACQSGDFDTAVALYTEAIALDPQNHILYSNRSAAHVKLQQYQKALQDAIKARDLNPKWPKVRK